MKISILLFLSALTTSVFAYTRGDICNDPQLANTGCQAVRTSCYALCNGSVASGLFGCRAECNSECDQCTQALGGTTAGAQYQTCMNAAKGCVDEKKCATAKNNLYEHCEALTTDALNAPPWVSVSLAPEGCGAPAVIPSCCAAKGQPCGTNDMGCCQGLVCGITASSSHSYACFLKL